MVSRLVPNNPPKIQAPAVDPQTGIFLPHYQRYLGSLNAGIPNPNTSWIEYVVLATTGGDIGNSGQIPYTYYNGTNNDGIGAYLNFAPNNVPEIDNFTPTVGNRVLIKDQLDERQNGIYEVSSDLTRLIRTSDFDSSSLGTIEIGATVLIYAPIYLGEQYSLLNQNALSIWTQDQFSSSAGNTVGVNRITFRQVSCRLPILCTSTDNPPDPTVYKGQYGSLLIDGDSQLWYATNDGVGFQWDAINAVPFGEYGTGGDLTGSYTNPFIKSIQQVPLLTPYATHIFADTGVFFVTTTTGITCNYMGGDASFTASSSSYGTATVIISSINGVPIALGGSFTTSGAHSLTLTTTNITNVTLPTIGTLSTLAGTETLSNKTLVTPILGTPSSGNLTNCTNIPVNQATGNLSVNNLNSGSGASSSTFWRGDGSWASPTYTGTVTSVGMTVPSILSISGSPITTSGTLAITLATESANTVFAGPTNGSAAAPTFRTLVAADLPVATFPKARAWLSNSTQSIPSNTATKLKLNSISYDTNSNFDYTTNYRFTPTVAGYYNVAATVQFVTVATVETIGIYIFKNGSEYSRSTQGFVPGFAAEFTVTVDDDVYCNGSSDYIEIYVLQTASTSQNINGGSPGNLTFAVFALRP